VLQVQLTQKTRAVEVVQLWDKNRPAANSMLFDFYIKLAEKEFAFLSDQKDHYYYQSRFSKKELHAVWIYQY
jgi:hypothetical protein